MKKLCFVTLAVGCLTGAVGAQAQSVIWHRDSNIEWAGGLAGKAHQPKGYYLFNHGYPNATGYALHTNWNVNDFTLANVPFGYGYQVSQNPGGYGSTSFQMGGGAAAAFLNAYGHGSALDFKIDGAFGGTVDNNGVKNWSLSPVAKVCFSTAHTVQSFWGGAEPKVQSYYSVFLHDTRLNKGFNMTIKMWANRNEGTNEGVGGSEVGRYVYAVIKDGSQFTTKEGASHNAVIGRIPTGERGWFHTCITRQNLTNIIAAYNNGLTEQEKISWNTDDYRLDSVFVQTEVMDLRHIIGINPDQSLNLGAVKEQSLMHVGVTWRDHAVVTLY
ncbi:hypothetical protein [Delftia acidovorans]|uniref:hypothetical protein n=2 Tax=Delftia acidovorans TaxID=80866 RepID=UPI0028B13775|nr:hypothetical protein [Delftia acidovorans]